MPVLTHFRSWLAFLFWLGLVWFAPGKSHAQCAATFYADSTGCFNGSTSFQSTDTALSWNHYWNFGDVLSGTDNEDTNANPSHVFSTSGTFYVRHIVTGDSGCTDTFIQQVQIFNSPIADFTWSNGCAGLLTSFLDASQSDSLDLINSWKWNIGSDTSVLQNPNSTFGTDGTYSVSLIVRTQGGCGDTVSKNITIFKKPTATRDANEACLNGSINFEADIVPSATSYTWDFGDSSSFTQRIVSHIYKKTGTVFPKLTVDFGSTKCLVAFDSIVVHGPPDPAFSIISDTQCFAQNNVCIQLSNPSQKIKSRTVIFDDGYVDDTTSLLTNLICHKYTDNVGGSYSITVEIIDSNNCIATKTLTNAVLIHPIIDARFTFTSGLGCFETDVNIINTSNQFPPKIAKFMWDFGDGILDSTNWSNFNHTYTIDGSFNIQLRIENSDGCWDTFLATQPINNTNFVVDAHIDSSAGYCRNNNYFVFKQTAVSGGSIEWYTGTANILTGFTSPYRYATPGLYKPFVVISKNGCDSTVILDSIVIYGPVARIGNFINRFQCQSKDTVYFQNGSLSFRNKSSSVFWDAGDKLGPQCTLITKDNQNIGQNCRYSLDSLNFHHKYPAGIDTCYYVKLVVKDTVIGCSDSIMAAIPLMHPKAKGSFVASDTTPCPGPEPYKRLTFNNNIPQPSCLKYAWWVMWDSLAAANSGNFNSYWNFNSIAHSYPYGQSNGDSNGMVTIGLIVENGTDTNGVVCRDTGWFHNNVRVVRMSPVFYSDYDSSKYYCKNSTFRFYLGDSNQNAGTQFTWNFGDGTILTTTNPSYKTHTYKNSGSYQVRLTVFNSSASCTGDTSLWVNVGVSTNFYTTSVANCTKDTLQLFEYNRYADPWNTGVAYWSDTNRANQGKEQIWYDLGDGSGFQNIGPNPVISYSTPGTYFISMAIKDSLGCMDTLKNFKVVRISGVFAGFILPSDTILCAQTVKLKSTASTVDPATSKGYPGDFVKTWEWNFGAQYARSFIKDPQRYFATGDYSIQLKVSNAYGCWDSVTKTLSVIGPIADYQFLSDTIGCAPLNVVFQNNSQNATDYIWQFADNLNSSFGTKQDTNVTFAYPDYGTFYPWLIARGSFTKNGITQVCDDVYPDTSMVLQKSVTVWELPKPDFAWNTNCATGTTNFTNTSQIVTGNIVSIFWDFGDGSTSTDTNPTHQFTDTGQYRIVIKIVSDHGCEDSLVRNIMISPTPFANFGYNLNCFGTASLFKDSTFAFNDRIYLWKWTFGDGSFSNQRNPSHMYGYDTAYNVKLHVTNIAGCSDSITKIITVFSKPKPNFTFADVCDKDSVIFTNTSTSKQALSNWSWSFGDGASSLSWNVNHLYSSPNLYDVKLVLKTIHNCMDSLQQTVRVSPNPVAKIYIEDPSQCYRYHNIVLHDTSQIASGSTYAKWYFGDGNQSDSSHPVYRYSAWGNYEVTLISTSNYGCKDTAKDSVFIYPMPVAKFILSNPDQCANYNNYTFRDSGSIPGGTYGLRWEFGNGNFSTNNPVNHHYPDTGNYSPLQILTSNFGCADSIYKTVNIWPMPVMNLVTNDSTQCLSGNDFIFTNNSNIAWGNLAHSWQFGDGNSDTVQNAQHAYTNYGLYQVLLIEESVKSCTDTAKHQVEVFPQPIPDFEIDDSLQCLTGNNFTFTNNSSIPYGSMSYRWDFGDGSSSTTTNANHSYGNYGNYLIQLVATSAENCRDSITQPNVVFPMPLVRLRVNQTSNCINTQNFVFTDSSSIDYGFLSPKWKFGDSTISYGFTVSKTFAYPKTYRVWLTELSNNGCADSAFTDITVFPKPSPGFTVNDSDQCLRGNTFVLTSTSNITSGSMNYSWDLGDGNTKTGNSISHSYVNFGTWNITLKPTSNNGCTDSLTLPVIVYPMPLATFSANDSTQCLRQNQFQFTNNSSIAYGVLDYFWQFGDGDTSHGNSPTHIYSNYGNYSVRLVAHSTANCLDTITRSTVVFPMPNVTFGINDSDQCFNAQNFVFTDYSNIPVGGITRFWKADDGATSTSSTFAHVFSSDTTHSIKLVQTSDEGCMDSIIKTVVVYSAPNAAFTVNDQDQCLRQNSFVFTNTSSIKKDTLQYSWDFGDGYGTSTKNTTHIYANIGPYTAILTVTSEHNCVDSMHLALLVDPMPVVKFAVNDSGQCVNDNNFIFQNLSGIASGTLSHIWKFGDGNSSFVQDPTKTYPLDTTYLVWLTETSDKGCQDSTSLPVTLFPKPMMAFSLNDSVQCLRQNTFISDNTTTIRYGTLSYFWAYGDGNSATSKDINYKYSTADTFHIQLRATSDLGCKDSLGIDITVAPMPIPDFSINDPSQCFNDQDFVFTNNSNIQSGSFSSVWNFGDAQTDSNTNAQHVYQNIGLYTVKYIATSDLGCMDSLSKLTRVFPNAKASFSTNDSDQCQNQQNYIFTNTSTIATGKIQSILWNLGNGSKATTQQVKSYYPASGSYRIRLYTTSDSGCTDSFTNIIRVYPKPASTFDVNDSAQCLFQNNYIFTDVSFDSLGVNQYYWNINNESTQTTKIATYKFKTFGFKNINLISTSLRGCSDTSNRIVYVKPMPDPKFETLATYYCENTGPYNLLPNTAGGTYYGKNINNQQYDPVILWKDTVKYIVTVNGCTDSSSQITQVYPGPKVDLGNDTTLCKLEFLHLKINSWQSSYQWNTGSTTSELRITSPGTYMVTVSNICGTKSDTITIQYRDINCRFFLPTAFTPNKDGINDFYKPAVFNLDSMNYIIFNRWGEIVFKGDLNSPGWDGTYLNAPAQDGVYIITVYYGYSNGPSHEVISEKGSFTLMR